MLDPVSADRIGILPNLETEDLSWLRKTQIRQVLHPSWRKGLECWNALGMRNGHYA